MKDYGLASVLLGFSGVAMTLGGVVATIYHDELKAYSRRLRWFRAELLAVIMMFGGVVMAVLAAGSCAGVTFRKGPAPTFATGTDSGLPPPTVTIAPEPANATVTVTVTAKQVAPRGGVHLEEVQFVQIPEGEVAVGCVPSDDQCAPNEPPAHPVKLEGAYSIAATEVTRLQYQVCVRAGKCHGREADTGAAGNVPVTGVDADDAAQFCEWLGGGLPSEAQWEHAARGGHEDWRFPTGAQLSIGEARYGDSDGRPSAVASYPPNGYGLFDMAGNVGEWCIGPNDAHGQPFILVKGGSVETPVGRLRVSARTLSSAGAASEAIGFRCVRNTGR